MILVLKMYPVRNLFPLFGARSVWFILIFYFYLLQNHEVIIMTIPTQSETLVCIQPIFDT